MVNRSSVTAVCLATTALMFSAPMSAQPVPLGQFAPIPILDPIQTESVIGLASLNSQLVLATSVWAYTSPSFPGPGQFTNDQLFRDIFVFLTPQSQVANNPLNASEIWATGGGGRVRPYTLYKIQNSSVGAFSAVNISLTVTSAPTSLASDGSAAYIIANGHLLKVDASNGNSLFDLGPSSFNAEPQQVVLGPDGLLYVLDSNASTGRVVRFDTGGNFKGQFPLSQPAAFTDVGPMVISPIGQLYSLSTDSSGTLGIDAYDTHTGNFLGRTSGAGTFSTDQGFNPGGHPAMVISNGYLYFTTGTGKYVWIFSTAFSGTPGAPNCQGKTVSALAQQYGSIAKAAAALGFQSVAALQAAITGFCGN